MTSPRLLALALALASFAFAQTGNGPIVGVARPGSQPDTLDELLAMVGPVPAGSSIHTERFGEFLRATAGPVPLVGEAFGAAIGQWSNSPKEWGQGWGAFGKRYGSNLAYNGIRQTITYGGSVLLGEDTRYFASRSDGVWSRIGHAVASTFTARHASGKTSFAFSSTAGVLGAGAIASVWGPGSWKGPGNIAENAGISFASTAATNIAREFLPDIFHRRRK